MRWLSRLSSTADRITDAVLIVGMVALLALITLQMVDRHLIDVPIREPDAYARICIIWLCFVGFASAVRAEMAIRVDLLDHWMSEQVRALLQIVFDLLILATVALLLTKGWLLVQIGGDQRILGTALTRAVPNAGLVVGCVALGIFVAVRWLQRLATFGR
ncbi:MAG: TRAP transporter small permease subunit [Rubrivivax sp.]